MRKYDAAWKRLRALEVAIEDARHDLTVDQSDEAEDLDDALVDLRDAIAKYLNTVEERENA